MEELHGRQAFRGIQEDTIGLPFQPQHEIDGQLLAERIRGQTAIGDGERPERTKKEKCSSTVFVRGVLFSRCSSAPIFWRIDRIATVTEETGQRKPSSGEGISCMVAELTY